LSIGSGSYLYKSLSTAASTSKGYEKIKVNYNVKHVDTMLVLNILLIYSIYTQWSTLEWVFEPPLQFIT